MSRRKIYTIKEVKEFALSKNGECLSTFYKNNKTKLIWKCGKCQHIWKMSFKPIKILGNWCPSCSGRLNNSIDVAHSIAKDRGGECLSTIYKNNKINMKWKCGKCKNIWEARLDRIKSGTWCPSCRRSRGERLIEKHLKSNAIEFIPEFRISLKNLRFDFYLPRLKIAIEFDGIQHFQIHKRYSRTKEELVYRQNLDIEKVKYCLDKGIQIIHIHYLDLNYVDYILHKIRHYNTKDLLVFTRWAEYQYIIDKIPITTQFSMLLTGVGR
jgi:DNA-directed RNA polymerase subunit RPC12/RpoP